MRRKSHAIVYACVLLYVVTATCGVGLAFLPYENYNYDFWANVVSAPQAYVLKVEIDSAQLEIGRFSSPADVFVAADDSVYVLDSGNNRVVKFDRQLNLESVIQEFETDGTPTCFNRPQGLFVTDLGHLYVADTDNARIVELDESGEFVREIGAPTSGIEGVVSDTFRYRPTRVAVDPAGRVFVVSRNTYDGMLEFDSDGVFRGFFGAPTVNPSIMDYFWQRIATREQRERMTSFLPTEFSSIDLDDRGFIYATVSSRSATTQQVIRKLDVSGRDVLRRLGFWDPVGDVQYPLLSDASIQGPSVLIDIAYLGNGIYSVLDAARGRVFTYEANGHLLYVFGALSEQKGAFHTPVALDGMNTGWEIVVLDRNTGCLAVYEPTKYAKTVLAAIQLYNAGRYDEATRLWEQVLTMNHNYDMAYTGIGRALLRQERYSEAMQYFMTGSNRAEYSKALAMYRSQVIEEHFGLGAMILLSLIVLVNVVTQIRRKRRAHAQLRAGAQRSPGAAAGALGGIVSRIPGWSRIQPVFVSTARAVAYSLHVIFHPVEGFAALKHERRGSVPAAAVLLFFVCLTYVSMRQYTGFVANLTDPRSLNIITEAVSVLFPFALWCGVNWALTTLMEGKGSLRDIFIASAYALVPLILVNIPATALSNVMIAEEFAFYYIIVLVGVVWAAWLLVVGSMVTHEYDFWKTLFTSLLVIPGIVVVLFLGLLFFDLIDQVLRFVSDIYTETTFRL